MSTPDELTYDARDLADSLELSVLALLRTPQIRQSLRDLLDIYGVTGQLRELTSNLHDQTLALAEIAAMSYGRLLEHDRRAVAMFTNILVILQHTETMIAALDDPRGEIAAVAKTIIGLLHDEATRQIQVIDDEAQKARILIQTAQDTARGKISEDAATATTTLSDAAAQAAESAAA